MKPFYLVKEDEYHHLLAKLHNNDANLLIENDKWKRLIENSSCWNCEIVLFAYFLSIYFEQKLKKGSSCIDELNKIISYTDKYYLDIQEFDVDFINYLMKGVRGKSLSLHELLYDRQSQYKELRGKTCVSIM